MTVQIQLLHERLWTLNTREFDVLRLRDFHDGYQSSRSMLLPNLNKNTTDLHLPVVRDNLFIKCYFNIINIKLQTISKLMKFFNPSK
jgi:hypothetical protein